MQPSISFYQLIETGKVHDLSLDEFPAKVYTWNHQPVQLPNGTSTHYGYVFEGEVSIECRYGKFHLQEGMYFSIPGACIFSGDGKGFCVEQKDFQGFFQIGGPVEWKGRLQYIDGCTDSLLIAPPVMGDPCFNLLHIPANTFQTQHTHPSFRAGVIVSGSGVCVTPEGEKQLIPGTVFVIPADGLHSFKTFEEDLRVIAYHPDSDFGPTHENHPMINRTIIE